METPMDPSNGSIRIADPATATEAELEEALLHWDELDSGSLAALSNHPEHGRRLHRLQLAEAWLREGGRAEDAPPSVLQCPDSMELFDYGHGPGSEALEEERRAEIDRHVLRCSDCRGLVMTLTSGPPIPIEELVLPEEAIRPLPRMVPEPSEPKTILPKRERAPLFQWIPLAAAAAIFGLAYMAPNVLDAGNDGFPEETIFRGRLHDALLHPRALQLWIPEEAPVEGLRIGCEPRFELSPVAGAESYRVEIRRTDGSATQEGELVALLEERTPDLGTHPLEPGTYTWTAWATVDGLERELGARDILVREDAELRASLVDGDVLSGVRLLHEAGYTSTARQLARSLPPGPGRDDYLGRVPAR